VSNPQQPASFGSMFLKMGGGVAAMFGLFALVAMVTGMEFEIGAAGAPGGVPLTSSAPGVAMLLGTAALCWWLGTRWDAPGWVDFRKRRRWFVPVVVTFVAFPLLVVALFMMLQ
jgi:hypothetical protein